MRRRRLPRILLNAATAVSLAMCVACLAVWPVTTRKSLAVRYVRDRGTGYQLATAPHGIELGARENFQATNEGLTPVPAGVSAASYPWGTVETRTLLNAFTPPREPGVLQHAFSITDAVHTYQEPENQCLGFGWDARTIPARAPVRNYRPIPGLGGLNGFGGNPASRAWRLVIPMWFAAAGFAVLPWARYRAAARERRRARAALCPACGYDLRATPDRCPECGEMPSIYPVKPLPEFTVSRGFAGTMILLCALSWATPLRGYLDTVGIVALTAGGLITLAGWPYGRGRQ